MSEPFFARKHRSSSYAVWLAILAVTLAASGCATVTRHGDVKRRDGSSGFTLLSPDHLLFPDVSLARAETYRFRVRDLPRVIYPSSFHFDVPTPEAVHSRTDQPWRRCLLRASLSKPDGLKFFTRTINFSKDWNGGLSHRGRRCDLYFGLLRLFPQNEVHGLPRHLSYDLTIEIIRPSRRATDKLRIAAWDTEF